LWGDKAGWAQTIMFIDDLNYFVKEKNESLQINTSKEFLLSSESATASVSNLKTNDSVTSGKNSKKRTNTTVNEIPSEKLLMSSKKKRVKSQN
jgi:hypothetical protein